MIAIFTLIRSFLEFVSRNSNLLVILNYRPQIDHACATELCCVKFTQVEISPHSRIARFSVAQLAKVYQDEGHVCFQDRGSETDSRVSSCGRKLYTVEQQNDARFIC
jgi:hypothetical protein